MTPMTTILIWMMMMTEPYQICALTNVQLDSECTHFL